MHRTRARIGAVLFALDSRAFMLPALRAYPSKRERTANGGVFTDHVIGPRNSSDSASIGVRVSGALPRNVPEDISANTSIKPNE